MKKIQIDKKYFAISCYALAVIVLSIIFWRVINNVESIGATVAALFQGAGAVLSAFVNGFFIAFVLNVPARFFERKVLGRIKALNGAAKAKRLISAAIIYIIALGTVFWLMAFIFPELVSSFRGLISATRSAVMSLYAMGGDLSSNEVVTSVIQAINDMFYTDYTVRGLLEQVTAPLLELLNTIPALMGQVYVNILAAMRNVANFIIGIIISFYMLYQKDVIAQGATKLLRAFSSKNLAEGVLEIARRSKHIMERFIIGQAIDSIVLGIMFFLIASLMRLPFPLLLTIIFAVTNMIPYFGPFIGGAVVSLLVMIQNPVMGAWTGVVCLILQQIDGNIIAPKILGDSIGLKPLSVMFSILVGGAMFGIPGMFFGAPVFAVIMIMARAYVNRRYSKKYPAAEGEADKDTNEPE